MIPAMHVRPYEKLVVWQEAYKLCLWIYILTKKFPSEEKFGLISQMRRSGYSVPIYIAEGNTKRSSKEKVHFLETAQASLEELHCESRLAKDLKYVTPEEFSKTDQQIHRVSYLLTKLRSSLS